MPELAAADLQQVEDVNRLLVTIAETHPGIVAKLRMLWGDVEADMPPPRALHAMARVLRTMAGGLDIQADRPLAEEG